MLGTGTSSNPGLCLTCNNCPTCFYHARRGPALFCELFDGRATPAEVGDGLVAATVRRAAAEDAGKYSGLCRNCEHREACAYPKPDGGVWHCENYE